MKLAHILKHILLPALLATIAGTALAQQAPPTIAQIFGSTGATDKSVAVFSFLLGDFFLNPLSSFGGSTTLIGGLFVIFNGFVFAIGLLWVGYGLISGIVETAHSGEVLGRRLSAVWLPIRMVTGMVGIAPVFGGYSLAQVFIVTMSALGIGIANMMWTGAIQMSNGFQTLVPASASMSAASPTGVDATAMAMFEVHVCDQAQQALNANVNSIDGYGQNVNPALGAGADVLAWATFGTPANPVSCGSIFLRAVNVRTNSSATGFRVSSVNYDAYLGLAQQMQSSAAGAFGALDSQVSSLATQWFTAYQQSITQNQPLPPYPKAALAAAAANYQNTVLGAMTSITSAQRAQNGALAADVQTRMQADGWFGAGSWFATFAEANAAMADVMRSVSFEVARPNIAATTSPTIADALKAIGSAQNKTSQAQVGSNTASAASQFAPVNAGICSALGLSTATGNCSIGQAIVEKGIQSAAIGSGGGGGGFFGDIGLINPIIMFKNMGDYSMVISETMYALLAWVDGSGVKDAITGEGVLGGAANAALKVGGWTIPGGSALLGALKQVMGILPFIAGTLMAIGLVMSIYIPMIPFITWMGGLVQYCVVVLQGLVGAPIAALSHLDAEGEGLGRRTEAGYMFALNVTFRPALMLLGFFFASAVMIALGSFQANLFMSAMANAQGNSITGLFTIIGYLVVFFVLNVTLIQGLFNMIFLLPDQILSLIGSGGHMADLGKEIESKVHGLFLVGTRMSSGVGGMIGRGGARSAASAASAKARGALRGAHDAEGAAGGRPAR